MMAYHVEREAWLLSGPTPAATTSCRSSGRVYLDVDDTGKAVATRKRVLDMAATGSVFVAGFHAVPRLGLREVRERISLVPVGTS
jgi:hypothetical protein